MDLDFDTIHWDLTGAELSPLNPPKDMKYPAEPVVLEAVIYGFDDQFVGSLVGSPQVQAANVVGVDSQNGGDVTFVVTGGDPVANNAVYIAWWGQNGPQDWQLVGSRIGNGNVASHYPVGLYAAKVVSSKVGYGSATGLGNLFYLTDMTNITRVRIRDAVANSTLKICYKLGFQGNYQSPGRDAFSIWVVPESVDGNLSMLGSEVGTTFSVLAPRQADFPPQDAFVPGSRFGIPDREGNTVWFDVDVNYPTEDIYYAPTFSLRLHRLNDITVEIDGDDI